MSGPPTRSRGVPPMTEPWNDTIAEDEEEGQADRERVLGREW